MLDPVASRKARFPVEHKTQLFFRKQILSVSLKAKIKCFIGKQTFPFQEKNQTSFGRMLATVFSRATGSA